MKGIVALALSVLVSFAIMSVYERSALSRAHSFFKYIDFAVTQLYHCN